MGARRYTLTITCGRPRSRACDDFHVQPERVAQTVAAFIGDDAELALTPRTVRLHVTDLGRIPDLDVWRSRMALVLDGLWLEVARVRGELCLPAPARFEIREVETEEPRP